jgi:hypothetical protein
LRSRSRQREPIPSAREIQRNDLQIAHAAGRFLEVRLERIGRVLVLGVALLLLEALRLEKSRRIERLAHRVAKPAEKRLAARDVARFEKRRFDRDVGARRFGAGFDRAHAMTGFQPDVPENADEPLDARRVLRRRFVGEQDQHVDVGGREKLAAAVAACRDERRLGLRSRRAPDFLQRAIDEARMFAQQRAGETPPARKRVRRSLRPSRSSARQRSSDMKGSSSCASVSTTRPRAEAPAYPPKL